MIADDVDRIRDPHDEILDLLADDSLAVRVVLSAALSALTDQAGGLIGLAKRSRTGVILWPRLKYDGMLFGGGNLAEAMLGKAPRLRGVLGYQGRTTLIQIGDLES